MTEYTPNNQNNYGQGAGQGTNSYSAPLPGASVSQPSPTPQTASAQGTIPTQAQTTNWGQQATGQTTQSTHYQYAQHTQAGNYQYAQNTQQTPTTQQARVAASSQKVKKPMTGKKSFLYGFLGAALACVLAFSGFGAYVVTSDTSSSETNQPVVEAVLGAATDTEIVQVSEDSSLAEVVADKCLPSVVSIYAYTSHSSGAYGFGDLFDSNQNSSGDLVQSAMGSGVVLSEDGYIITNYHVVEGAERLMVSLEGGSEMIEATVVGSDESSDIAVIKLKESAKVSPIEIGSSSDLAVGEWVMALGSPYGLEQSISTGIVSAVSRSYAMDSTNGVTLYTNLIQTDAAINQGNSGGALVDSNGKLIGINTLISSTSGDSAGVGFAIPIDYAIGIAQDLIAGKTPSHALLGVSLGSVSNSLADRNGLSTTDGAYIEAVVEGSAADDAGIEEGDIILSFDGDSITSASDLMLSVRSVYPGDTVEVELMRDGERLTLKVTLGSDAD